MSFEEFDRGTVFGLTLYSYISGWACLAGAVGVVKVSHDNQDGAFLMPLTFFVEQCQTTPPLQHLLLGRSGSPCWLLRRQRRHALYSTLGHL